MKILPVLASLSVIALVAADPAMAQTPGGWNGNGPFIAAGRVRPVYIAPLMNAAPPPYTTRPGFVGAIPLVEALPPPPPIAALPPPLPPPLETCVVDPRDIGLAPFLNVRAGPAGWPIAMLPNWTPVAITPEQVGPWVHIVAPLDGWVFRPYLYCPEPLPPPLAYATPPPRANGKSPLPPPTARTPPRGRTTPPYGPFEREPD